MRASFGFIAILRTADSFHRIFGRGSSMFYSDNFGGNLNFVSRHELFGQRNILTIGLSPQVRRRAHVKTTRISSDTQVQRPREAIGSSINVPVYLEDQLYLAPRLSILAGAQAIFAERHFVDEFFDRRGRKSIKSAGFLGIQSQAGRDLRNQSPDTGIHEFQSQLATAFVRQSGRVYGRSEFQRCLHTACSRNTPGPSKSERAENIRGFSGSCRFIARGFVMNCSRSMTLSGTILGQETYRAQIIKESRQVWKLNCFGKSWCQSSRIAQAIVCHSIRATRSTIFISIRTLFTATIASREFRFTFMKRNCFTKARLVSMRVQTCSVTFRVIQSMRRTRSLRIVMRCLVSVRDFDGPTDSQSLSIAGT